MNIDQQPTRIRHVVVAAGFLMSVLLYLHRFCVSLAQTYIQENLGLTNPQRLFLNELQIRDVVVAELKKVLPNCDIQQY